MQIVKDAVYKNAKKLIIEAIVTKLPFLAGEFCNPILGFFVGRILDIVYAQLWRTISFALVDYEVKAQKDAYDASVVQIKAVLDKQGVTGAEVEKAKKEFEDRLHTIIRFPVSVTQ